MKLYHGSPHLFSAFRTPNNISCWDVTSGGVIYLTEDRQVAAKYAGPGGFVYEVRAVDARPYAEQRQRQSLKKKKGKYTRGVWVALPEGCKIVGVSPAPAARLRRADGSRDACAAGGEETLR